MALRSVSKILLSRFIPQRGIHVMTRNNGLKDTPMPNEVIMTGYEKIAADAAKVGEDPFEAQNRDEYTKLAGSGTRKDPYIVMSRNDKRAVSVEMGFESGTPPIFWVTKEEGGRCPITGDHYKLKIIEGDKWGIDELDLFAHH